MARFIITIVSKDKKSLSFNWSHCVFRLEGTLSIWTRLGRHLLVVCLFVSSRHKTSRYTCGRIIRRCASPKTWKVGIKGSSSGRKLRPLAWKDPIACLRHFLDEHESASNIGDYSPTQAHGKLRMIIVVLNAIYAIC